MSTSLLSYENADDLVEWRQRGRVVNWPVRTNDPNTNVTEFSRAITRMTLTRWGVTDDDYRGDVVVVVNELVTNAILHTRIASSLASATLARWAKTIGRPRDGVLVSVHDLHPYPAHIVIPIHDEMGRGLDIVRSLATARGGWLSQPKDPRGPGKSVQAWLPMPE